MAARLRVEVTGRQELERVLDAMDPERRPRVVRASLTEAGTKLVRLIRTKYLQGPAPSRLEKRTGRTIRGILLDRSGLSREYVEVGSIAELWWLENYETGTGRRGARPFLGPAVREMLPEIEEIFARHWDQEITRA